MGEVSTKILKYDAANKLLTTEEIRVSIRPPDGEGVSRSFSKGKITIGTLEGNDLVVKGDEYVSRRHCKIEVSGDMLIVTDLGSTNGIIYNGERVDKISLKNGGSFKIGRTEVDIRLGRSSRRLVPDSAKGLGDLIAVSKEMREVFSLIKHAASSDATVCVMGESGTGKELVAREIHRLSRRAASPFVAINCGAIPPTIIESELFGHEKGAFTGASTLHRGVFEQADGGTLFLDEIGEMPPELQTRLLRVLETSSVRRIGGQRDIKVDVRIIAATNQDLGRLVEERRFREDLFFRLYVFPIYLPPLRERKEDIPVLAEHFARGFGVDTKGKIFTEGAISKLLSHKWPGNVRELKNTIQRAVILSPSLPIGPDSIKIAAATVNLGGDRSLSNQEKNAIIEALRRTRGNKTRAASVLGISRSALINKIKRFAIRREDVGA
jgi:DNA-binding NtrC family response regulator